MPVDAAGSGTEDAAKIAATPLMTLVAGKNYWPVKLVRPAGGSPGLLAFIGLAEMAIQTAVDLLGRGMPKPPPKVDDLLQPVVLDDIGKGKGVDEYEKAITAVQARQTTLLTLDTQVLKTSVVVAAEQNETLRAIKTIVAELNAALTAAGTAKLQPAQEKALLKKVADAVDAVYDKVEAVAKLNEDMAGGNKSGGGTEQVSAGGAATGGGGGGDGGLGGILPMLAMLPMAAMPLLSQIPELLEQQEEKRKEAEEEAKKDPAESADPNAAGPPPGVQAGEPGGPPPAVNAEPIPDPTAVV
ncbi:hypothetical protein AB0H71_33185 [Nocardia sp. NPDC050697]|uniref:hypothetical protein n=1 Tax=Nocardia sp. NPDC050697 TaxID=3155158 RepID=UPI0033D194CE